MFKECNVEFDEDGQVKPKAMFQREGYCTFCSAPVYVETLDASLVTRPVLHYTCNDHDCPGRLEDPYWSPQYTPGAKFQDTMKKLKKMSLEGKKAREDAMLVKSKPKQETPTIIIKSSEDHILNWM